MSPAGGGVAVKICGLTRPGDAAMAQAAGAGYVGVVLSPGFRRSVTAARAAEILAEVDSCARVGVFVDATAEEITGAVDALRLDVVQMHGGETPALLREVSRSGARAWKAVRPRASGDVARALEIWGGIADGLLLDGWSAHAPGGTGARFDWTLAAREWPAGQPPRRIAAGGLDPDNVDGAIAALAPDIVDVSSGVESVHGRKDPALVGRFLAAVAGAGPGPEGAERRAGPTGPTGPTGRPGPTHPAGPA